MRGRAHQDETVLVVRRDGGETVSRAVRERDPRMSGPGDGAPGRAVDRLLRGGRPAGVRNQQRTVERVSRRPAPVPALQDIRGHHVRDESRYRHTKQREFTVCACFRLAWFKFIRVA